MAGLRQSLSDDRGNLTLQFVKLANAIDAVRSTAGKQPIWIAWENVPGVLSTSDNAFGSFLAGLCGRDAAIPQPEGGWTRAGVVNGPDRLAAWRILDAQHFGVAQRRKRVFVLALGGPGRWAAADALLPIIKSSEWHPAPGREKGEGVAKCLTTGVGKRYNPETETLPVAEPPIMVRMREGKEGGGKGPLVSEDRSLTLATANDQVLAVRTANTNANGHRVSEGLAHTIDRANGQVLACPTLTASNDPSRSPQSSEVTQQVAAVHAASMQVRRLTPVECERLQGFPDNYTRIPWRGKPAEDCPDGPRYKAMGNSMAVPVMRWIGERIAEVEKSSPNTCTGQKLLQPLDRTTTKTLRR